MTTGELEVLVALLIRWAHDAAITATETEVVNPVLQQAVSRLAKAYKSK